MAEFIKLKWEYKVVGHISERDMNNLGQCGWELVNVTFYNNGTICDMIFKRPILERSEVINDGQCTVPVKYDYEVIGNIYDNPELLSTK